MSRRILGAMVLGLAIFGPVVSSPAASPRIGQTHDPAWGGHAMVVAGDGFVPGQTEFRVWSPQWDQIDKERAAAKGSPAAAPPSDSEKDLTVQQRLLGYLGQPLPALPAAPPPNSLPCPVLRCTEQLAAIEFPRYTRHYSGPARRYLAVLYAGDKQSGWSVPWVFNRTSAHFLTADAVAPGENVRVVGRNLWTGGSPPLVALFDRRTATATVCPTRGRYYIHFNVNPYYDREFTVPASVAAGHYELWVHDGTGEAYGWSGPLPLAVAVPASAAPMVFDARAFGVLANGVADDASALQQALDEAGRQSPSIVLLPAGICRVGKMLTIPPGVVVRGMGMSNSILRSLGDVPLRNMISGSTDFAMEDLAIEATGPHVVHLVQVSRKEALAENVRFERCRFTSLEPDRRREIALDRARRLRIAHCEFKDAGAYGGYAELSYIGHNRSDVTHWLHGGLGLGLARLSRNCLVEHNRAIGQRGSGGVNSGQHYRTLFARNSAERTLTSDGEAFMLEGGGAAWYGRPVSPRPDQVQFPADGWIWRRKPEDFPKHLDYHVKPYIDHYVVAITKGKGLGQYRKIAALRDGLMILESPWGVPPDETSEAVLMHGSIECAMVNNMALDTNGTVGGLFYSGAMNTVIHGHVGVRSGGAYVWSIVEPPDPARKDGVRHALTPNYFNQIIGCRIFDKGNVFLSDGILNRFASDRLEAVPQLGTLVAQNEICYPRDFGWGASSFIDRTADPAQDQENPDRGKFPAVVVSGWNVFPAIEENKIHGADVGVWLGPQTQGGIVRRNAFTGVRYERVKDLGRDSLIGAFTGKTEFHSYWGAGLNIDLLPQQK